MGLLHPITLSHVRSNAHTGQVGIYASKEGLFFTLRVIRRWNLFLEEVLTSNSVKQFRSKLGVMTDICAVIVTFMLNLSNTTDSWHQKKQHMYLHQGCLVQDVTVMCGLEGG